ncbi:MAG: hypothetical protein AAB696_01060 [Patescibacteria group bacterium]
MGEKKEKDATEEVKFDVERISEREVILIAKNKNGIVRTTIYLWPKEIFY